MSEAVAVGVDVGGTKLVAAAVTQDGDVVAQGRATTPRGDAEALVRGVVSLVRSLGTTAVPVGLGIAGIVDRHGRLRYGPNLGLANVPVSAMLRDQLDVPVMAVNDADAAVYGEHIAGAGRGVDDVLMLTLGTGVGGGIILAGGLVTGANGLGAELGHLIVHDGGRQCPCGNTGCLEAYASGTAVGDRATVRLASGDVDSILRGTVDGKAVTMAAQEGDRFATEILAEAGYWLGVGLASLVNVFDPARILIGGGAGVNAADLIIEPARAAMADRVLGAAYRSLPEVIPAALGDQAGMVGAAILALRQDRS